MQMQNEHPQKPSSEIGIGLTICIRYRCKRNQSFIACTLYLLARPNRIIFRGSASRARKPLAPSLTVAGSTATGPRIPCKSFIFSSRGRASSSFEQDFSILLINSRPRSVPCFNFECVVVRAFTYSVPVNLDCVKLCCYEAPYLPTARVHFVHPSSFL